MDLSFKIFNTQIAVKRVQKLTPLTKSIALNDTVLVQNRVFIKKKKGYARKVGRCISFNAKKKTVCLVHSNRNNEACWYPINMCLPVSMKKKIRITIGKKQYSI